MSSFIKVRKIKSFIRFTAKRSLKKFPKLYKMYLSCYYMVFHREKLEKNTHFGELYPDETVYIIRGADNNKRGMMSLFCSIVGEIRYAERAGYIPVIDLKNGDSPYCDGVHNAWEAWFKQPDRITLEEAYESKHVILSGYSLHKKEFLDLWIRLNGTKPDYEMVKGWYALLSRKFLYSESVSELIAEGRNQVQPQSCIGIFARGTDYLVLQPTGERIQPTPEQILHKLEEFEQKYGLLNVFLVTEDAGIFEVMQSKLGERLKAVTFDRLVKGYGGYLYLNQSGLITEPVTGGAVYLAKLQLLAECSYYIGGLASGSMYSLIMNHNTYIDSYVFNLGYYK